MTSAVAERTVLAVTYLVLFAVGVVTATIEAFWVPLRLFGGVEGLAVVLAVAGNLILGSLAAIGTQRVAATVALILGWFLTLGFITARPGQDVILPGELPSDPGVVKVAAALLLLGVLGGGGAMVVAVRYTRRGGEPTPQS